MRILVVEDASNIRMALAKMLKKWGHDVVTARDGVEAWDILQSSPISLVLSDWMMPKMDGVELCQRLRDAGGDRYVYFVLLTSRSELDDLVAGMDAGADDFLVKPCDKGELKARLRAAERILSLHEQLAERNEQVEAAYSTIKKDLEAAGNVQRSLLPTAATAIGKTRFNWLFSPSTYVAGDIFNFFPLDDEHLAFYHLDVAGHGIPSALMSVTLSNVLKPQPGADSLMLETSRQGSRSIVSPAQLVETLNERFQTTPESMLYFTMVYGTLNHATGELQFCQAGHPNPIFMPAAAGGSLVGDGGFPVGMFPDVDYESVSLKLDKGDRLILYSDGITECMDSSDTQFGEDGLMKLLDDYREDDMDEALTELSQRLTVWKGDDEFSDDISVLALEVH